VHLSIVMISGACKNEKAEDSGQGTGGVNGVGGSGTEGGSPGATGTGGMTTPPPGNVEALPASTFVFQRTVKTPATGYQGIIVAYDLAKRSESVIATQYGTINGVTLSPEEVGTLRGRS